MEALYWLGGKKYIYFLEIAAKVLLLFFAGINTI